MGNGVGTCGTVSGFIGRAMGQAAAKLVNHVIPCVGGVVHSVNEFSSHTHNTEVLHKQPAFSIIGVEGALVVTHDTVHVGKGTFVVLNKLDGTNGAVGSKMAGQKLLLNR